MWGSFSMQGEYAAALGSYSAVLLARSIRAITAGTSMPAGTSLARRGPTRPTPGEFGRPKVKHPVLWGKGGGGWGAWQIAGRYDVLDLSDKSTAVVGFNSNTARA